MMIDLSALHLALAPRVGADAHHLVGDGVAEGVALDTILCQRSSHRAVLRTTTACGTTSLLRTHITLQVMHITIDEQRY